MGSASPTAIPAKKRRGRPVEAVLELGAAICEEMATGKSLRECCRERNVPIGTFFLWMHSHTSLAEQYERAREIRGELLADEIIAVADTADAENAYAVKVRVDARKWCAARMARKVYGDSQSVQLSGSVQLDIAERLEQLRNAARPVEAPERAE